MQKLLLSICCTLLLAAAAPAQKTEIYPVLVSFNSICCGVPDSGPIMKLVNTFKKQNRIKHIVADNIGPMGKEGEYYLAFRLKELNKTQRIKFIQQLKKIAPTMLDKGTADIKENISVDKAGLSRGATIISVEL